MTSATSDTPPATPLPNQSKPPVLSWEFVTLLLLFLALATVRLAQPTGSLSGRIAMEQDGFNLYSYNMKDNKVYAIAIGPREGVEQERGVWVDKDGHFKIDNLPVGEYSLRVKVPGFSSAYESGIFVEEGKATEMPDPISLEISHPNITVASSRHVFTSKETPSFWASASDATTVRARVFKKDLRELVAKASENNGQDVLGVEISPELSIYKPYNAVDKTYEIFGKMQPVKEWRRTVRPDGEDWSHEDFAFDKPLDKGDYFAVVEAANVKGETDWGLVWFSVTDIGLIVKQDPEKVLVRAIDLNSLKPLKGVDIEMLNRQASAAPHQLIARGKYKTDDSGFVTVNIPSADRQWLNGTLMVCGFLGNSHAYGGMSAYSSNGDALKTYFYTDRPVYRLGQTVYFKGIARASEPDGFKNRGGGLDVKVKFEDPENQEIWSGNVKTTSFGTFNGLLSIPKEGKTGAYQITLTYPDGTADYERVEIDQYRKPEYKVEVIPLEERVSAGSKAKARVRATYYFGAPVAHAKVKYSIFSNTDWSSRYNLKPRPDYYSYFDDWESGGGEDYSGSGNYITEGYVETDDSGEAIVEFPTTAVANEPDAIFTDAYLDRRYKIDVEVTDISRLSVLNSGAVNVTAGDFALFVDPTNYVTVAGQPISSSVSAFDYHGQPMSNVPVRLQLLRRVWDRVKHVYKGVEVFEELTTRTDAKGEARVTFETKAKYATDTYYVVATAKDAEGHNIASSDSLWVASENYPYVLSSDEAKKEPLQVKLDKAVYEPGDKAKVMITAPVTGVEGAQAIVTIEGPKLYKYQVVDLKATANLVEIPIEKQFAPNVYVGVTFVGLKHQFYNQTEMVKVSPKANFLNLEVKTAKMKYKPGDTVTYVIKATDSQGKPAPKAELSLGVVDESIYAIRPEYATDIRKFFYSQRSNAVNTMCSFPEENSGGPNKIEPKVRKDFKDTAIWLPNLVTNAEGMVTANVKLPDNLTTWRATVRGVTSDTKVGSCIQKIVATQDLIVRLALPRFFCQGDEGQISAIVHNYSDVAQDITLTLNASKEFQLSTGVRNKVRVEPEKAARISWPARIVSAGTGVVNVKAVGQTSGDAMEVKLPVRPLGVPVLLTRSGFIDGDDVTAELPIEYPADASPGSLKASLSLASSSLGPILGNFGSLIEYPYGCTEQTMSRLMPAVVAIKINRELGAPLDPKLAKKFDKVYEMAMEKLRSYHHSDGGWGWWPTDESNMYLTSIVLEGFKLLEGVGYAVSSDDSGSGVSWLKTAQGNAIRQLSDPLRKKDYWRETELVNDLAKSSYALTLYKEKLSPEVKKFLCNDSLRNRLAPEALAYLTMALKAEGDSDQAQKVYERLVGLANTIEDQSGGTMNWERTNAMYRKLSPDDKLNYSYYDSYRYTGVETTALALRTALVMEPSNTTRLEAIKRWITLERGKDGWGNTKTTAEVFRAFTEDEVIRAKNADAGAQTDFQADVNLSAAAPLNFGFSKSSMFKPEQSINLDLKAGKAKPSIHKVGKGRLYWTSTMSYYKVLKPGDKSLVQGMPEGLQIRREFLRLVAGAPDADGNVKFKQQPIKDGKVKAGETLLMKVYVDSPTTVPYILMEACLPSGAEVVSSDPRENLSSGDNESTEINTDDEFGSWWWSHQDVLDDKIAYFVTSLPNGKHEIHTMVRLELPGKFQINPVFMEGMYTNKVRGYSSAGEITVLE